MISIFKYKSVWELRIETCDGRLTLERIPDMDGIYFHPFGNARLGCIHGQDLELSIDLQCNSAQLYDTKYWEEREELRLDIGCELSISIAWANKGAMRMCEVVYYFVESDSEACTSGKVWV